MIFKSIKYIGDKNSKSSFIEKVDIYVRLIELYSQYYKKKKVVSVVEPNEGIITEMTNIGVIENVEDITALKSLLGKERFNKFITSVNEYISSPDEYEPIVFKLRNKSRKQLQQNEVVANKPKMADFFCGAGGLSCGFVQAGYKVVFANEIESVCCDTYLFNHPEMPEEKLIQRDIRTIINDIPNLIDQDADIVVGGPPCQGFSSANQQRMIDDPRNELYKYYLKAIQIICPKIVVMENVRGMLTVANQVIEDYQAMIINKNGQRYTYTAAYRLLNSQNFGVAQSRERLIYIALRNDVAAQYCITPQSVLTEIENSCKGNKIYNLTEPLAQIKPLEAPRVKGQTDLDDEKTGMKIDYNKYNSCGNEYLNLINGGRQIPFVFNHKARYCSDVNYEIFKRLGQGEDSTDPKIADIMPYSSRNHCFKDKYYKLIANKPCRTITAHLKMDCLSHIHPYQVRSITPREAARIQSFPDDYVFLGAYLKTYMQIGNAVPVLMAKQIANVLKKYL